MVDIKSRWAQSRFGAYRFDERDRGDVPGWVLVTLMTAGLVAGLWAVAGDVLNDVFLDAVNGVTGER
ncbi:MAG: hypothetical protein ACRCTR_05715 [Actinomycetota bacterium]